MENNPHGHEVYKDEPPKVIIHDILNLSQEKQEEFANVFRAQLEPLYGSQDDALEKIFNVQDRKANVIINNDDEIAGILVYKNNPVSEHGVSNTLEIKTLMLLEPNKNGGKGYGIHLIHEVENAAMYMDASRIMVTVAADKPESQTFFNKHGFVGISEIQDAYREGNIETIFVKEVSYGDPV